MLTDPTDPDRVLVEVSDLDGDHDLVLRYGDALRRVVTWAREYLCRPHPELGRKGPVCPFAQTALDRGTFFLAVRPGRPSAEEVAELLAGYRSWFQRLVSPPRVSPQFRTILVLLPDALVEVVDAAQRALKPEYVEAGLMIGEFYPGPPPKPGLWNADFRPLSSPVPLLAIRQMVATDLPFLKDDPRQAAAYAERFGDRSRAAIAAARGR
ncbi:hypothetical protein EDD27_0391 [Nonomuraea polychroma]|uniref:DUF6875 domain-containing protein n=1 Tax=Nonomuraea polychroma TaxID=46176 RepID=A0A438LX74_9ACTN|nr:hypothetical protein [Nonomuraea polychroma]RVX38100.1 hypothetical protein EDD27_0391 [Nonomuraea polychroma]